MPEENKRRVPPPPPSGDVVNERRVPPPPPSDDEKKKVEKSQAQNQKSSIPSLEGLPSGYQNLQNRVAGTGSVATAPLVAAPNQIKKDNVQKELGALTKQGLGFGNQVAQPTASTMGQDVGYGGKVDLTTLVSKKPQAPTFVQGGDEFFKNESAKLQQQMEADLVAAGTNEKFRQQVISQYQPKIDELNKKSTELTASKQASKVLVSPPKKGSIDLEVVKQGKVVTAPQKTEEEKFLEQNRTLETDLGFFGGEIGSKFNYEKGLQEAKQKDLETTFVETNLDEWAKTNQVSENQLKYLKSKQEAVKKGERFDMKEVDEFVTTSNNYDRELYEAGVSGETMADFSFRKKKESADEIFETLPESMREFNKSLFSLNSKSRDLLSSYDIKVDPKTGQYDLSRLSERDREYLNSELGKVQSERENLLKKTYFTINDDIVKRKSGAKDLEATIKMAEARLKTLTDPNQKMQLQKAIDKARGGLESLNDEISELQRSKTSFFESDPKAVKSEVNSSPSAKAIFNALPENLSGKEKFDFYYRELNNKNKELAKKYGIDESRLDAIGQNVRDWLDIESLGLTLSKEEKEYMANKRILQSLSPLYFNNTVGITEESGGFVESFMSGFANVVNPTTTLRRNQTAMGGEVLQFIADKGLDKALTTDKALKDIEDRVSDIPWYSTETLAGAFGSTAAIIADMTVGGAILAPVKGAKTFRAIASAYDKTMDATTFGKYLKPFVDEGLKYESVGNIIGSSEDELNFASGFIGTIGGELVGKAFKKLGSDKLTKHVVSMFGSNSERAAEVLKRAGEINARGIGEVGEEFTQELVGIYNDELREKGFWEEVESRYGSFNDVMKLVASSYIMGAGFGANTDAVSKKLESQLTDEERATVNQVVQSVRDDVASGVEAMTEVSENITNSESVTDAPVSTVTATAETVTEEKPVVEAENVPTENIGGETQMEVVEEKRPTIIEDKGNVQGTEYTDENGRFYSEKEVLSMTPEQLSTITLRNPSNEVKTFVESTFDTKEEVPPVVEQTIADVGGETTPDVSPISEAKPFESNAQEQVAPITGNNIESKKAEIKKLEQEKKSYEGNRTQVNVGDKFIYTFGLARDGLATIIKDNNDGTVQVKYADGTIKRERKANLVSYLNEQNGVYNEIDGINKVDRIIEINNEINRLNKEIKDLSEINTEIPIVNSDGSLTRDDIEKITDLEDRKSAEIQYIMSLLFSGVGESSAKKIKEYVDRILNGEQTRDDVIDGLSNSFIEGIDALLAANGVETQTEVTSPTEKIGGETQTESEPSVEQIDTQEQRVEKTAENVQTKEKSSEEETLVAKENFVPTKKQIDGAKKIGRGLVSMAGKLSLMGATNRPFRQRIIENLTGVKVPLSKATVQATIEALISAAEIDAENLSDAAIERRIVEWLNSETKQAEKESKVTQTQKKKVIEDNADSYSTNPIYQAMKYFADGGKITTDAIQKLYGSKGIKKNIGGETKARLSMIDNTNGITLDKLYELIEQRLIDSGIEKENIDINEIMDVVNTTISENNSVVTIVDSLYDMVNEGSIQAEKEAVENAMGKEMSVFDKAISKLDELEKQLDKFGKETMGVSIPIPILKAALKAAKKTLEVTGDTYKMIEEAVQYIKDTKWYENLNGTERKSTEQDLRDYFSGDKNLEDLVSSEPIAQQETTQEKSTVGENRRKQSRPASRVINLPKSILDKLKKMTEYDVMNREKTVNELQSWVKEVGAESAYEYAKSNTDLPIHIRGGIILIAGAEMTKDALSIRNQAEKTNDAELLAIATEMLERASFINAEGSLMSTDAGQLSALTAGIYEAYPLFYNASVLEKEGGFSGPNRKQQQGIAEFQIDLQDGVSETVDSELTDEAVGEVVSSAGKKASNKSDKRAEREAKERAVRKKIEDAKKKFFGGKSSASASVAFLSKEQIEAIGEMIGAYLELGTIKASSVVNRVYRELADFDSRLEKKHIMSIARDLAEFEAKYQAEKNDAELKRIEKLKKKLDDLKSGKETVSDTDRTESDDVRLLKEEIENERVLKPSVIRQLVKDYMRGNTEGFSSLASAIAIKTGLDPYDASILAAEIEAKLKDKVKKMVDKKLEKFIEKNSDKAVTTANLRSKKSRGEATKEELEELARREDAVKAQRESEQIMNILSSGQLSSNQRLAEAFQKRFGYSSLSPETKKRVDAIVTQINELQQQITKSVTTSGGKVVELNTVQRLRIKKLQSQLNTLLDTQKPWNVARVVKHINSAFYVGALSGVMTLARAAQGGYITSLVGAIVYTATNIVYVSKDANGNRQLKFGGKNLLQAMVEAGKSGSAAWQRAMLARKTGIDTFGDNVMKGDASSDTKDWIERTFLLGLGDALNERKYGKVITGTIGQVLKGVHALGALDSFLNTAFGNYVGVNEQLKAGETIEDVDADLKQLALDEYNAMVENTRREIQSEGFTGDIESEITKRLRKGLGIQGSRYSAKKVYTTTRVQELRENQRYDTFMKGVALAKYYSMISEGDGVFGWLSSKGKEKMAIKDTDSAMSAIAKGIMGSLFRFINMTGNSLNMVITNIPGVGIIPSIIGLSKNPDTNEWSFGRKYKNNPLLTQQRIASNVIMSTITAMVFANMFDWDDDEEKLVLDPDRAFDIRGFGEKGMGGAKKNERKFEDWRNLSISFTKDKDGNFTNYISVKLIPPFAAMIASLSTWSDPMNHYRTWTDDGIGQIRLDDLSRNPFSTSNLLGAIGNNIQIFSEQPFSSVGRLYKNFSAEKNAFDGLVNAMSGFAVDNLKPIINPSSIQSITRTIQKYADSPQKEAPGVKQLVNNLYGLDAFITDNKTDVFGNTYPEETEYERFLEEFLGAGEKRSEKIRNIGLLYKFGEGANITKKNFTEMKKKSDEGFIVYYTDYFGDSWSEKYLSLDDELAVEAQNIQEKLFNDYVNENYEYLNSLPDKETLESELKDYQEFSVKEAKRTIVEKYEKTNKIKKIEKDL